MWKDTDTKKTNSCTSEILSIPTANNLCSQGDITCGLYVHPEKGWLGASPDGKVCDPNSSSSGIAEMKCSFSKADVSVQNACGDDNFY